MRAFFDNSPDWLTLFRATKDGRFIYEDLNRATAHAYGLSPDQVIGRALEEILGVEQAQLPLRHMRACIETGETQRYSARRTLAGRTRIIDVMFVRAPRSRTATISSCRRRATSPSARRCRSSCASRRKWKRSAT